MVVGEGVSLVQADFDPTALFFGLEAQGRIGLPILLEYSTLFPYLGVGVRGGIAQEETGSDNFIFRVSFLADIGMMLRPFPKWSIGVSAGSSFATDNGLRLEGIPLRVLLMYSLGKGKVVTQEEPVTPQVQSGENDDI